MPMASIPLANSLLSPSLSLQITPFLHLSSSYPQCSHLPSARCRFRLSAPRSPVVLASSHSGVANSVPTRNGSYTVGDFMTGKEQLHVVKASTTVDEALEKLVEKRITGFPVIDDDWKLVGVVSDYDLLALDSISGGPQSDSNLFPDVDSSWKVGAIEGDEELTPLGHHLAKLPVDVLIGKMMLYGAIFGCLSPILSIAAFLSYKSPFVYPKDEREKVERAKLALLADKPDASSDSNDGVGQSDHLVMMVAYTRWEKIQREKGVKAAQQFCNSYFLSSSVMHMIRDMRAQFGTLLADIGLISLPKKYQGKKKENLDSWISDMSQPFNMHSHLFSVVKAILCAGLYPNVAATEQGLSGAALSSLRQSSGPAPKGRPLWYDGRREVYIHPSSINNNLKAFQYPFLVFLEKVETNKVFLRDTTVVSPYSILLFGGSIIVQHQSGLVIIDGWLKLTAPAQTAVLFKELRLTLHSILNELVRKPENATVLNNEVVRSMIHLLAEENNQMT